VSEKNTDSFQSSPAEAGITIVDCQLQPFVSILARLSGHYAKSPKSENISILARRSGRCEADNYLLAHHCVSILARRSGRCDAPLITSGSRVVVVSILARLSGHCDRVPGSLHRVASPAVSILARLSGHCDRIRRARSSLFQSSPAEAGVAIGRKTPILAVSILARRSGRCDTRRPCCSTNDCTFQSSPA